MRQKTHPLKQGLSRVLKYEKIRFALVGGINTGIDFVVFLTLTIAFGIPAAGANIISTSCAMAASYLLNKHAVFRGHRGGREQIIQFIIVTLTGQWVVQTSLIVIFSTILEMFVGRSYSAVILVISKLLAISVSLVWNYWWYSRVVFKKESE